MEEMKTSDLDVHRSLKNAIAELNDEKEPSKDLWPGIKSSLTTKERVSRNSSWFTWGTAATFIVSLGILGVSWNNVKQAEQMMLHAESVSTQYEEKLLVQLENMEREYGLAKSTYLAQIQYNSPSLKRVSSSSGGESGITEQLAVFEKATRDLKAAIKAQPSDPNLPNLLRATYQQELAVLSQLARLNQNVFSEERI